MNEDLQKTFTREEVEVALKQMAPLKPLDQVGTMHMFFNLIEILWEKRYVMQL